MGYRSELVVFISSEVDVPTGVHTALDTMKDSSEVKIDRKLVLYHIDNIKWYANAVGVPNPGYEDVQLVEDFIHKHRDTCGYVRIGEEAGDIDYVGVADNYCWVETNPVIHFSEEIENAN